MFYIFTLKVHKDKFIGILSLSSFTGSFTTQQSECIHLDFPTEEKKKQ